MKCIMRYLLFAGLFAVDVAAQNPSFGGKEFRRVWVNGTIPEGASASPSLSELYLTPAGIYVQSYLNENGIYFVDDAGAVAVVVKNEPPFTGIDGFRVLGWEPDGGLIFSVLDSVLYPCQLYNGNGLNALTTPTREQEQNMANYFDGRMVYMTYSGSTRTRIWYYTKGNPPALWLEDATTPGLAGPLDYDGETLAYSVGVTGGYELWKRAADGTLTRILGYGDIMPGEAASVFVSTPAEDTVEVDQGKVYMLASGYAPNTRILFSSSDGVTFDVIAKRFEAIPGLPGITINDMTLIQVRDGKVWLWVKQSDGDEVLYQIVNGVWTRVVGKLDSFDGRSAYNMVAYEHGTLGDGVVVVVAVPLSVPPYYGEEIYTNADLPGFSSVSAGSVLNILPATGGGWMVATLGEAGTTNTLQSISSLTNSTWEAVGAPQVADGTNAMEWTIAPTNPAGFFRLTK